MKFGKKLLAVGGAVALAATLGACGAKDSGGDSGAAGDAKEILVWDYLGQGASNDAMVASVAAFEKANPGYKIKRESFAYGDLSKSIVQGGVGGSVPDVAIVDNVDNQNFAALGLLKDISASAEAKEANFYPGPWSSTQMEGKTYGLPLNSNNLALYYNKDLFDAAGVAAPTTWEELKDVAKKMTSADQTGLAISAVKNEQGTFQFLPFVWQTGGDLDNYDVSGAEALAYLKGLIDDGSMSAAVANYSQEDARTQFVSKKAAMMINGPWELQNLKDAGINFGVAPLPKGKAAATGLGGENIVVFEDGKNSEGGQKFLEFMASNEGAGAFCDAAGQLPSRPDLAGKLEFSKDANMQVFEKQLEIAHARAYGKEYAKVSEVVQESLQKALTGAAAPDAAAKEAADALKPLLAAK